VLVPEKEYKKKTTTKEYTKRLDDKPTSLFTTIYASHVIEA
jgi:hypothetical protein